jgi:alkyl hydroperoxide reductase subunit F
VTLYSAEFCPFCKIAKDFLEKNNISFVMHDVQNDAEKAKEMVQKSGQSGVPVFDIDGKIIVGFDEPKIREALGL